MAQISYAESMELAARNTDMIGFFSLPKDGDSAIVRFMHDSVDDFIIITRHEIGQGKDYRTINCLRNPRDPMDQCPFCAAGVKVAQRGYFKILKYGTDDAGNVTITPCIWERSTNFATTLKGYIENYGPLSNIICKITRNGTGLSTQYEIIPNLNQDIYRPDIYQRKPELFDGYTVIGNAIRDVTADDMRVYLQTGKFPESDNNTVAAPVAPAYPPQPVAPQPAMPVTNVMPSQGNFNVPASAAEYTPYATAPVASASPMTIGTSPASCAPVTTAMPQASGVAPAGWGSAAPYPAADRPVRRYS